MKEFVIDVEKVEKVEKKNNGQVVKDEKGQPVIEELKTTIKVPIIPVKIQKGRGQGSEYLAPKDLSTMSLNDLLKIFPSDDLWNKLIKPKIKQFCATITTEASIEAGRVTAAMINSKQNKKKRKYTEEKPIQDEEKFYEAFSRMFQTLSARGESLAGLTRQQNELLMELLSLDSKKPDYGVRSVALLDEIRKVREAIDDKKADDSEESGEDEGEDKPEAVAA
ncbi:MAG TPA: hypothetical protein VF849_00115 [Blattabacteriaceae bacterium]